MLIWLIRMTLLLEDYDLFVFDFDGVLTNNKVIVNQDGSESVLCSRSDGLAFDYLNLVNKSTLILSTETNGVVEARAKKLKSECIKASKNKVDDLRLYLTKNNFSSDRVIYVGNDLNDYHVMQFVGLSFCPADSHQRIIDLATYCLNTCGGNDGGRSIL